MKRGNSVISIEVVDFPKKQRFDLQSCEKDLPPSLTTTCTCRHSSKRSACCLEPPQSDDGKELEDIPKFSFWKRFKSDLDVPVPNLDPRSMSYENAMHQDHVGSNVEPNEEFSCFNYWRVAPPDIELVDVSMSCSQMEQGELDAPSSADVEFNAFKYWRTNLPQIDELR